MLLALGTRPRIAPPQLADLIRKLPAHDKSALAGASEWLFPGQRPGTHMSVGGLSEALNKLGLNSSQARNTALIGLSREVPSPVVADAVGLNAVTISNWAQLAGERFQTYPAARQPNSVPNE